MVGPRMGRQAFRPNIKNLGSAPVFVSMVYEYDHKAAKLPGRRVQSIAVRDNSGIKREALIVFGGLIQVENELFFSALLLKVEPRGFEPLTSSMPLRRSTN